MLKRIGAEESGEFKAVASGTLPCGKPVVVNADGTVSSITQTTTGAGTPVEVSSADYINDAQAVYDPDTGKIVIAYHRDASNHYYGAAIVGTISGSSISFGSEVKFQANNTQGMNGLSMCYDTSQDKIFIAYGDKQNSQYAAGVVGTVSGTSISFGTTVILNSESVSRTACEFDSSNNKILLAYRRGNAQGGAEVITLSGSSISSGSVTVFNSGNIRRPGIAFSTASNKFVLVYRDIDNSSRGRYIVATISGTSVSYGGEAALNNVSSEQPSITYDASIDKFLAVYRDSDDSNKIKARVGTLSGTTVSWGSIAVVSSGNATFPCVESKGDGTAIITFSDFTTSPVSNPRFVVATISGTSVTFSSAITVASVYSESGSIGSLNYVAYDTVNEKFVYPYNDMPSGQAANSTLDAAVLQIGSTTLTSENYIGMSRGVAFQSPIAEGVGSSVQYKTASIADHYPVIFDSNSNKTVIAYQDAGDSNKGKARVGTVSGTSISFGTEATFSASNLYQGVNGVFDSSNNKIVIVYRDTGNSSYGTAIIGTVSGTDITFGSPVVFNSANCFWFGIAFDSTNNKVVLAYRDQGNNSGHGSAIVGTVSGTSISFGSEATLESSVCSKYELAYDTTNQKIVAVYVDGSSSGPLRSKVGTVSGTSISFGSEATVDSDECTSPRIVFNPDTGTTIFVYTNNTDTFRGTSKIGTVSGTSISFSSESVYSTRGDSQGLVYDSTAQKIVIAYRDTGNGNDGYIVVGTVGASSISYGTPLEFANYDVEWLNSVFDSNSNKVVTTYSDQSNSNYGTAIVFQNAGTETIRGEVASGQAASMDIIGSVSDNQIGLTAGQQYFVQTDGTIGTTAATPSVLAGTAISATELVVKT